MDVERLNRAAEPPARRVTRVVAVTLALVLPGAVLFGLLTARISGESARTSGVLRGVEALRPVGTLAAALADARAGAVSDGADVAAVRSAAAEVDTAAAAPGGLPGGDERWADLRGRIALTADRDAGGPAAAQEYGTLGVLTLGLSAAVADAGGALDGGRAGTGSLAILAGTGLPELVVASAEYVETVAAVREVPDDPALVGRQAAVRERVADLADEVEQELTSGVDPGAGGLDEALLARSGDFRAALASLVTSAAFSAPDSGTDDVDRIRGQQQQVVRTAAELQRAVLAELSGRAGGRAAALGTELAFTVGAGVLALAVAGWLLWTGLAGPARRPDGPEPDGPAPDPDVVMLDARRLLGRPEELVRVGRAVRRPRGNGPRTVQHQEPVHGPA